MSSPTAFFSLILFIILTTLSHHHNHFFVVSQPPVEELLTTSSTVRLGKPLVGDDGTVYTCSGKFAYAFMSNGSMAWNVHLNYTCNHTIPPLYAAKNQVYIVAENKVLRIIGTHKPVVEVFLGNESKKDESDEIIGITASMFTSSVYVNIKEKGLFAYTLKGNFRWSILPLLDRFGYHQGCVKNVTACHFTSVPVIDRCEGSVYISNNQGELYAISARRPYFKWIHDFSSFDKKFTVSPGKNGNLYVSIPAKALVVCLDVLTGEVLWEKGIGPLNSAEHSPIVDSNGWISIGSLDGYLYSISPKGALKKFSKASPSESVVQVSPILDCSGYGVYFSQTVMDGKSSHVVGDYTYVSAMKPKNVVFSLLVPATESYYWSEVYPGQFSLNLSQTDLQKFVLDEEIVLAFIASAKIGNHLACRSTRLKLAFGCSGVKSKSVSVYTGNERTILLFLLFETLIMVILAAVVRFCYIFWGKQKLQNQPLGKFFEKRRSLRNRKREFDHTISELEQKASHEPTTSNIVQTLSGLVQKREGIQRKLSTTYSLGRDNTKNPHKSVLPIYDSKSSGYSFRGTSSDTESSQDKDSEQDLDREIELTAKGKGKAKVNEPIETVSYSDEGDCTEGMYGSSSRSSSRDYLGILHLHDDEAGKVISGDDKAGKLTPGRSAGRIWLKRRRFSSPNN